MTKILAVKTYLKYLFWRLVLTTIKPIAGFTKTEIQDGAAGLAGMTFKEIKNKWQKL